MLKLTILNKPKELLLKCTSKFPDVILANLQEKEITPSKQIQEVVSDKPYDGLSKVTVQSIPEEYIVPVGTKEIETNGNYDVREYANASVNVPEKQLGTKTITANGTYLASDDNLDGYSSVSVETSGVDINDYFNTDLSNYYSIKLTSTLKSIPKLITSNKLTNMSSFYESCEKLESVDLTGFVTENVEYMKFLFYGCIKLKTIDFGNFNGNKVMTISSMFNGCSSLTTIIPKNFFKTLSPVEASRLFYGCSALETLNLGDMDGSKIVSMSDSFRNCSKLKNLTFLSNYGQGFTTAGKDSSYTLDLSYTDLTHDSLMDVINKLYDLNLTYNVSSGGTLYTQSLILGSKLLAKLTAEEVAIGTSKGWSIS